MLNRILPACCIVAMMMLAVSEGCSHGNSLNKYGRDAYILKGSMHFIHVESGCWQFTAEDGKQYELIGTDLSALRKEGIKAEIIVRETLNTNSTCMTGTLVELLHIINTH
jgi:hypothetical protein